MTGWRFELAGEMGELGVSYAVDSIQFRHSFARKLYSKGLHIGNEQVTLRLGAVVFLGALWADQFADTEVPEAS